MILEAVHGYVILAAVAGAFVNIWGGLKVVSARRKYGITYPQMYAEKTDKHSKEFNCVQRAHQNMIENLPVFYVTLFTGSIFRPYTAAALGFIRVFGFIVYIASYSSGDPQKRMRGGFGYVGYIGLILLSMEAAIRLISQ